jgi:hypothetical protein
MASDSQLHGEAQAFVRHPVLLGIDRGQSPRR